MIDYLFILFSLFFAYRRQLRYLRILQQEDYEAIRLIRWLLATKSFDRRASAVCFIAYWLPYPLFWALSGISLLALFEEDPRKSGKIRLHLTERAQNTLYVSLFLFVILAYALMCQFPALLPLDLAIAVQTLPFLLALSNRCTWPFEKRKQALFLEEAQEIIQKKNPYIIGITGSFGKTSTKAILKETLSLALAPTFAPKKSINTLMGVTRVIREELRSAHRYAIFEMGAYRIGSIARMAKLTPPQAAIITAVDYMHLDRFGSPENVFQAKSELAKALPADGILVCNGDNPGARQISKDHPKRLNLLYGFDASQPLDCHITAYQLSERGSHFTLRWQGQDYSGRTPLFGKGAVLNCAACFTLAVALGADPQLVMRSFALLRPVDNRLQVLREGSGWLIRDAYNSNPAGFATALEVLAELPAKRRLLMTPGMIELGDKQFIANQEIGERAAKICHEVFLVGTENRQALSEGLLAGGLEPERIHLCQTREEAFQAISRMRQEEDAWLIENDLTDIYEQPAGF
ncbi:MAG: murF [Chlamydiales bacterium]|jgi:UDP-N-acetylmuramoyl-tripeptide--D-alanyl-D-alanine ligase|nr:murF [Chlamydiales bacterium]